MTAIDRPQQAETEEQPDPYAGRLGLARLLAYCYGTSLPALLGVAFAAQFVAVQAAHPSPRSADFIDNFAAWDGQWYARIATEGYTYSREQASSVAFFPLFPLLAAALMRVTGMSASWALLLVAHVSLIASFVLLARYAAARRPTSPAGAEYALLAFGLFPTTFYFRMAYSEPLFLLLTLAAMLGMARRWRPVLIAAVIGLATATRPVGVALLAPFAIHLWRLNRRLSLGERTPFRGAKGDFTRKRPSAAVRLCLAAPVMLLACWGLLAYMAYQHRTFADPLAFAKTQVHWGHPAAPLSPWHRAWRLVTLAPLRGVYDPANPCHWAQHAPHDDAAFNLMFANPLYFAFAAGSIALGAWRRWLTAGEIALAAALLGVPYLTQADRMCMASQARFAIVVFPIYLVLANLLARMPPPLVAVACGIAGILTGLYSALFVSWYWFY